MNAGFLKGHDIKLYHIIWYQSLTRLPFSTTKKVPKSQTTVGGGFNNFVIFLPYLGKIPIFDEHNFWDGRLKLPPNPKNLLRSWQSWQTANLPTLHSRRSIHSPRDLYIDPPNINMEIGWHLSFLPDGNRVELHGGENSVVFETEGVRERDRFVGDGLLVFVCFFLGSEKQS